MSEKRMMKNKGKDRKHVMEKMYNRVSCVLAWSQMCLCCLANSYGYYHGNHTSWPCSTVRSRTRLEYMDIGNGSKHWKLAMSTIHSKTSVFLKSTYKYSAYSLVKVYTFYCLKMLSKKGTHLKMKESYRNISELIQK